MGSFLALLGIRIGRALVSWGLGSAGGGGVVPSTERPCVHIGAPARLLTAAPGVAVRVLRTDIGAPIRLLTSTPGVPETC